MAIVPVGQFGPPRPSSFAGLAEKTSEIAARKESQRNEIAMQSAKQSIDATERNYKQYKESFQDLSDMPVDKRALYVKTPEGMAFLKEAKNALGKDVVDKNGDPLYFPRSKVARLTQDEKFDLAKRVKTMEAEIRSNARMSLDTAASIIEIYGYAYEENPITNMQRSMNRVLDIANKRVEEEGTGQPNAPNPLLDPGNSNSNAISKWLAGRGLDQ